ncbi:hypothetical protein LY76DRAFT_42504 [Colletotrichum caudatum]|nr:hypothetical protein LY76DRAFT_42504 [Colletotrichum caudatum]
MSPNRPRYPRSCLRSAAANNQKVRITTQLGLGKQLAVILLVLGLWDDGPALVAEADDARLVVVSGEQRRQAVVLVLVLPGVSSRTWRPSSAASELESGWRIASC